MPTLQPALQNRVLPILRSLFGKEGAMHELSNFYEEQEIGCILHMSHHLRGRISTTIFTILEDAVVAFLHVIESL